MFKQLRRNKKGFTLVELIVVIAILAVLAAVLVPTMLGIVGKAEQNAAEAQITAINSAYKMLLIESGQKEAAITAEKLLDETTADSSKISKKEIIDYFESGLLSGDFDLLFDDSGKIIKIHYDGYTKTLATSEIVKGALV